MIGTTFDTATTALAGKCILWAENEVNKYLSKRYVISSFMTTTGIPPLLTSLTEQMAEGYMYMRQSRGGKEAMARGQAMIKEARSNLELIMSYKADLISAAGDVVADASSTSYRIQSSTSGYSNTFNEDSELNWQVSGNKLDDISDERDE
jgi:hypothetical protein